MITLNATERIELACFKRGTTGGEVAGDGGGDSGVREARHGPWRGSVAVALRKVESGARAEWPQYRGFVRSVTVQRVSAPRPARPPHLPNACARLTVHFMNYEPFLWHSMILM